MPADMSGPLGMNAFGYQGIDWLPSVDASLACGTVPA